MQPGVSHVVCKGPTSCRMQNYMPGFAFYNPAQRRADIWKDTPDALRRCRQPSSVRRMLKPLGGGAGQAA